MGTRYDRRLGIHAGCPLSGADGCVPILPLFEEVDAQGIAGLDLADFHRGCAWCARGYLPVSTGQSPFSHVAGPRAGR